MSVKSSRSHVYVNMKGEPRGVFRIALSQNRCVKLQQAIPARERKETKQALSAFTLKPAESYLCGLKPSVRIKTSHWVTMRSEVLFHKVTRSFREKREC
jgi:hypothetical protein